MRINSETAMLEVGKGLGREILAQYNFRPRVIELIGDVGAGKTTFTRGLAEGLGIKEPVTSPSFTISKAYAFKVREEATELSGERFDSKSGNAEPDSKTAELIHYDFYRLGDPGLLADDLAEAIAAPLNLVVVEWGESVAEILPKKRLVVKISLNDDGSREVEITGNEGSTEAKMAENGSGDGGEWQIAGNGTDRK